MTYERELHFAEKFLKNFHLNISYVTKKSPINNEDCHVFGLQDILTLADKFHVAPRNLTQLEKR